MNVSEIWKQNFRFRGSRFCKRPEGFPDYLLHKNSTPGRLFSLGKYMKGGGKDPFHGIATFHWSDSGKS